MSVFTDYAAKMRQVRTPFSSPAGEPQGTRMNQRENPLEVHGGQSVPMIDSGNALASLAAMMGPTPAEREAAERRMQKNQAQMAAWTGLFDGLRQLGNLYYASKGATPQKFDNPYQQVEQQYQQQRGLYNDMANYRRQYATSLYSLQRQMDAEQRVKESHQAQLNWYKNRDEQNTRKVDIQQFKAETDAAYKQATVEQKEKLLEIRERLSDGEISLKEARRQQALAMAAKANRTGSGRGANNGTYGYEKRKWIDEKGVWHEERVPTTGVKESPQQPSSPKEPQQPKQATKKSKQQRIENKGKKKVNW